MTFQITSFLYFVALWFPWVESQFPKECVNLESLRDKTCCPTPNGFKAPCGSDRDRGECRDMIVRRWDKAYSHFQEFHKGDDRHNWPNALFNRNCKCKSNFAGYDCSKCKYGYHGDDCNQKRLLKRRNFAKLTNDEKHRYMSYINKTRYVDSDYVVSRSSYQEIQERTLAGQDPTSLFHNVTVFDLFVWVHYYAALGPVHADNLTGTVMDFAHEGQGFLTWHRLYLLAIERTIQEVTEDEEFAIPYWDWTVNEDKCEICTEDLLGVTEGDGTVKGKYFNNWSTICTYEDTLMTQMCDPATKNPVLERLKESDKKKMKENGYHMTFPSKKDVNFALRFDTFDLPPYSADSSCNFRNLLEGFINTTTGYRLPNVHSLHNRVHLVIGGAMSSSVSASNDPIFFLHHSSVDRVLEKWLRKYNKNVSVLSSYDAPIGHNRGDVIVPLFPVYTHENIFKKSFEFGYDYEDVDEEGNSADDEESLLSSLGLCPVVRNKEPDDDTVEDCTTCVIIASIFGGIIFFLLISLLTIAYRHFHKPLAVQPAS